MKRVYTLYRVSTKGQVDKDDIPMQRQCCNEFAMKQGWKIVKEFSEKGVSGFKVSSEDRDAVQDLKTAAIKGEFDILLVFMFDRLGRREDETPFVLQWFVQQGIEVWSTQEGEQRFDNHVDKLMNYIRFWQASGESIKTSIRIKTRMEQLTKEGIYTGGNIPYGYKLVPSGTTNKKGKELLNIVVDDEEAELVRGIFNKTLKEGYGSYRIASWLNDQNIRTHNGSKFASMTVNRILRNKAYCGYLISGDTESCHLPHLQIVDEAVFERVQDIVNQRINKFHEERTISLNTKGHTLLSGNIFCAHCNSHLTVTKYRDSYTRKDGSEYKVEQLKYTCYHKTRKLKPCDGQTSYNAETIDEAVVNILKDMFIKIKDTPQDKAIEKRYKSQIESCNAKRKRLKAEIDKLSKELNTLKSEIVKTLTGDSKFTSDMLGEAINITTEKITNTQNQLQKVEHEIGNKQEVIRNLGNHYNQFVDWANEFEQASLEEKKMIACQLIKRVNVSRGYQIDIECNVDYEQFCTGI